jgi:glycosyltransferase involved in cell wall biosynthesis
MRFSTHQPTSGDPIGRATRGAPIGTFRSVCRDRYAPAMSPRVALWAHRLRGADRGTGLGRYVTELVRGLGDLGADGSAFPRYDLRAVSDGGRPDWVPPSIGHVPLRAPRRPLHLAWAALHRPAIEAVSEPADLVHSLYPSFPCPSRAPLVVTIFDTYTLDHPEWYGRMEGWAGRRALRHAADHAARIIVSSSWSAGRVREALGVEGARLATVPAGVDGPVRPVDPGSIPGTLHRFGLSTERYVIAVGSVTWRKNLSVAVQAVAAHPGIELVVVGPQEPGPTAALAAEIDRLGVADRVRLLGAVSEDDLWVLIAGALALVHPSVSEGFGFTPLEAMASGVPALASRAGSLPEVLGDGAVLLDPTDADAWAAAIDELDEPTRRAALVARGRERARAYTWARTAELTSAVHLDVLARS